MAVRMPGRLTEAVAAALVVVVSSGNFLKLIHFQADPFSSLAQPQPGMQKNSLRT